MLKYRHRYNVHQIVLHVTEFGLVMGYYADMLSLPCADLRSLTDEGNELQVLYSIMEWISVFVYGNFLYKYPFQWLNLIFISFSKRIWT